MSQSEAQEESSEGAEVGEETETGFHKKPEQSQVYTATRDTLFQKKFTQRETHALVST